MKVPEPMLWRLPVRTWWEYLNVGAAGVGLGFLGSLAFIYNWDLNPLLWRVFSPKAVSIGPGDHHALIMLLFGAVFYLTMRKVNPLMTALGVFFYVYSYEALWYLTYIPSRLYWGGPFEWSWMVIALNCIPAFVGYVVIFGNPWKYLAWLVPMFAGWFAIGFPITNDFPGRTAVFFDLNVNAFEIWTHLWAAAGFFIFIYPVLKKRSDKIKLRWWNPGRVDPSQEEEEQKDGTLHKTISVNS